MIPIEPLMVFFSGRCLLALSSVRTDAYRFHRLSSPIKGHLDIDPNDVGRQQAVAVAERLSGESKISAMYPSDLKRALETAETIARRCGGFR